MSKSDMELSEDWDIIPSVNEGKANAEGDRIDNSSSNKNEEDKILVEGAVVQDIVDQETAVGNESSSSDIDIIDENLEEIDQSSTSCFIPSTLTISSSVEKSMGSICDEPLLPPTEAISTIDSSRADETEKDMSEDRDINNTDESSSTSFTICSRSILDWCILAWEFFQSLSGFQLSCLFGLTFCLYFCITVNHTNIIAMQEGNVVSQMEKLVEELRNDNKHLKEQMLSEMKNDKLVSSFEHQIRELKKENSKLNHMLYDVVKVLEKQKDTQEKLLEKKEEEYEAPFRKEINKLKEHINMLKFDNEELQKQLVRIRYASYAQGQKHATTKDKKEHGKASNEHDKKHSSTKNEKASEKLKNEDETGEDFSGEIPMDIHQLKKWNELLDQVIKELGSFAGKEKFNSASGEKGDWNWRAELKRTFKKPHAYVSEVASNYANLYGNVFKKVYKSAKNYIVDAQENVQSFVKSFQDQKQNEKLEQNNKIWNIIDDLGEKWASVKQGVLTAYEAHKMQQKEKFKDVKKSDVSKNDLEEPTKQETKEQGEHDTESYFRGTEENLPNDYENDKWFFKRANLREKLREDDDEVKVKWFFKRANLREKLREDDDEASVNWFLKKQERDILSEQSEDTVDKNKKQEF